MQNYYEEIEKYRKKEVILKTNLANNQEDLKMKKKSSNKH